MGADDEPESADSFLEAVARIDSEATPDRLAPGARVGRFTIRGELGRGGMGVVYRAVDEQLGRGVALKMLRAGSDGVQQTRFLREARSAAALVHPNVATLYEIGETDGELFIAMELIAGEDLRRVLARGPLPIDEVIRIGLGIGRGVAAAHRSGIVHRDLKPENVMLDGDGEPKVLDFGLAKLIDGALAEQALTDKGLLLGTSGYMSPEQASGEPVDARSDVFSFGVVLFELVAGRRPFLGRSRTEVFLAVASEAAPRLETLRPDVPRALEDIIRACLEKAPSARPATMREVVDALAQVARAATGDAVLTERSQRPSIGPRWRTLGVILLLAAFGGVALLSLALRTHGPSGNVPTLDADSRRADAGASAASAPSAVHTMTAYPPPVTKSAEAAAAYASGMQDLRDASVAQAAADLSRALELDPSFPAAHLRLLSPWWRGTLVAGAREHYAAALRSRESLDARDRLFLGVGEAVIQSPVSWPEVANRLRSVLTRYPDDVEALASLSWVSLHASDVAAARTAAERSLVIDPQFALGYWLLAGTFDLESADEAERLLKKCLVIAPNAASCLRILSERYRFAGRCSESEDAARRMVTVEPKGVLAYLSLADALAVRGAPIETTRTLLDRVQVLLAQDDFPFRDVTMALLLADFPAAIASCQQVDRALASETTEAGHVPAAMIQITSLEEEGRAGEAFAVAENFERRSLAWVADDWRVRHYLLYARHHKGLIGDDAFARSSARLEAEALAQRTERSAPSITVVLRTAYAEPADLATARPYLDQASPLPEVEALRGHALLLDGRAAEALAPLRVGAAECGILARDDNHEETESMWAGYQTFGFMRAHLWLGEALEATGDTAGACTAYGVVLDRWKNARPRSITLEAAKTHSRALHCP